MIGEVRAIAKGKGWTIWFAILVVHSEGTFVANREASVIAPVRGHFLRRGESQGIQTKRRTHFGRVLAALPASMALGRYGPPRRCKGARRAVAFGRGRICRSQERVLGRRRVSINGTQTIRRPARRRRLSPCMNDASDRLALLMST